LEEKKRGGEGGEPNPDVSVGFAGYWGKGGEKTVYFGAEKKKKKACSCTKRRAVSTKKGGKKGKKGDPKNGEKGGGRDPLQLPWACYEGGAGTNREMKRKDELD